MYVWGHSYEFSNDGNWGLMEEFCSLVSGRDDIWRATNIEIVDYMKAAKRLKFTVAADLVHNPNSCGVWIQVGENIVEVPGGATVEI
jgi:hypothetical protein